MDLLHILGIVGGILFGSLGAWIAVSNQYRARLKEAVDSARADQKEKSETKAELERLARHSAANERQAEMVVERMQSKIDTLNAKLNGNR